MSHFTPSVPTSRRPLPSSLSSTRHANSYSPYPTSLRPSHFPSRPRFPASPAIPLSPYTSLTPASDSPYPLSAPAPTPSSAFRTSSSAGRSRSRENPFEQLDAPAFDHFVDDIAGRIRSALAGPSKPKRVRREEREKKKGEMGEREKEERDVFGEIKAVEVEPAEAGCVPAFSLPFRSSSSPRRKLTSMREQHLLPTSLAPKARGPSTPLRPRLHNLRLYL